MIGNNPKFPIGTKYCPRGRNSREHTVVDILRTFNSAGNLVAVHYVSTHDFAGQTLTSRNVIETTIAMGNPILPETEIGDLTVKIVYETKSAIGL